MIIKLKNFVTGPRMCPLKVQNMEPYIRCRNGIVISKNVRRTADTGSKIGYTQYQNNTKKFLTVLKSSFDQESLNFLSGSLSFNILQTEFMRVATFLQVFFVCVIPRKHVLHFAN